MAPRRSMARLAGLLYVLMAISGAFAILYVRSQLVVEGDPAATARQFLEQESLYRAGLVSDLVSQVLFVGLLYVLYRLLHGVHEGSAILMVLLAGVGIPIALLNTGNLVAAHELASGASHLKPIGPDERHAQLMVFLELHDHGIRVAQIFWGLWLLPLGYLVYASGFLPATLGILLMIGGPGYVIATFSDILVPAYSPVIAPIAATIPAIGEISLMFWLLIKGTASFGSRRQPEAV